MQTYALTCLTKPCSIADLPLEWKKSKKSYFSESVMITICEDVTLIRVDIAQGAEGRGDVYMNVCWWVCLFV